MHRCRNSYKVDALTHKFVWCQGHWRVPASWNGPIVHTLRKHHTLLCYDQTKSMGQLVERRTFGLCPFGLLFTAH